MTTPKPLPKTHKAVVLNNPGPNFHLSINTIPLPPLPPSSVLVRVLTCALCHSDISLARSLFGPPSHILGHEGIARIVALSPDLPTSAIISSHSPTDPPLPNPLRIGQLVGIGFIRDACGSCPGCSQDEARCSLRALSGWFTPGCLSEYAVVPARYITPVPELSPEILAPIMCAGVTAYKALKTASLRAGQTILLFGGGGSLGQLGVQYGWAMGLRVFVVDTGAEKKAAVLESGAEAFIDFVTENVKERVHQMTNGNMMDAILVLVGSIPVYNSTPELLGMYGTLVCVGISEPGKLMGFEPQWLMHNGIKILSSMVGTRQDIKEAMEFVERGIVKPKFKVIKVQDIDQAFKDIRDGRTSEKIVVKMDFKDTKL